MKNTPTRSQIPALAGQRVLTGYTFHDESSGHGVVLHLEDGSIISIEFECECKITATVAQSKTSDSETITLELNAEPHP